MSIYNVHFIIKSSCKPSRASLLHIVHIISPWLLQWDVYNISMIDNFFEEDSYHSYDKVYTDGLSQHHIYLGDSQAAMDNDFHMRCQIQTVVTAAKNMEHVIIGDGIKHVVYPLLDGKSENITVFFERFYELVEGSIKKGNLLVHCAAGISRSATLVISYIMRKEKMTFKDAIGLVRKARPTVMPNLGFQRQLKKYQETLRTGAKNSRNSRRSDVRTSQSGKSEGSIKLQLLPYVAGFSHLPKADGEKGKRFLQKFSEKDIQILKIYNNGKRDINKNRIFLLNRGRNAMIGSIKQRAIKTEQSQEKSESFIKVFRVQKKEAKPKQTIDEMQQISSRKRTDAFKKKMLNQRGQTLNHNTQCKEIL